MTLSLLMNWKSFTFCPTLLLVSFCNSGCSIDDKMLAFVFLGNLFVLEDLNGSKGMLNYHPISFGITAPDFEVEMIHILENKNVIVLCSQV
jgi:hypothetical protein